MAPLHIAVREEYALRSIPSELSFHSVGSNSSFDSAPNTETTHRRRKRDVLDRPIEHTEPPPVDDSDSFFADDNSEAPRFRTAKRSPWLIPADHPYKVLWDLGTVMVSFIGAYHAHTSIRDRSFGMSPLLVFCESWFLIDILLNFVTQHKSLNGIVLKDSKSVWARYLTTWFVVDVISLFPWERYYVTPIIELQKKRNIFKKYFFRTKAVIRVTRILRGRHVKLFRAAAKTTRHAGVGARGLLRLLIKYLPKYIFFWRTMKGIIVVRILRHFHYMGRFAKIFHKEKLDDDTLSLSEWEDDDYSQVY